MLFFLQRGIKIRLTDIQNYQVINSFLITRALNLVFGVVEKEIYIIGKP